MIILYPLVFFISSFIIFYLSLHFWLHDFNIPMKRNFFPKSGKKRHKIMAIFPHPNDETTVAATLAYLSPLPNAVTVLLTLTRGGEGYWGKQKFTKGELKNIREKELRKAAGKLGIDKVIILDYPDTNLSLLGTERYDDREGFYGHKDHILVSRAVTKAVQEIKNQWPIRLYWTVMPKNVMKMVEEAVKKRLNTPSPQFCLSFFRLGFSGLRALHRRYLAFICHKSQFILFRKEMRIPFWLANLIMHRDYFYWKKI